MSERDIEAFLVKSAESLAGAESEYANGRLNNCANRAYFACFHAAVDALMREGISPPGQARRWGHDYVQARFVGDLINRRRRYPGALRETLIRGLELRLSADYKTERITAIQANRAVTRSRDFANAIAQKGDTEQ